MHQLRRQAQSAHQDQCLYHSHHWPSLLPAEPPEFVATDLLLHLLSLLIQGLCLPGDVLCHQRFQYLSLYAQILSETLILCQ